MTKSELILQLAKKYPQLTAKDIELTVRHILGGISGTLGKQGRVEIRGFGTFTNNHRPPRTGRNPKTGESVMVPAKAVPHFRTGKELRERVDYK